MKTFISILFLFCLFVSNSCSKSGEATQSKYDTLATGWTRIQTNEEFPFYDICFQNNTGYAITGSKLYRSVDGGSNWNSIAMPTHAFVRVGMGSEANAVILSTAGKIIYTHNGGMNFDSTSIADEDLVDVFFVAPAIAYAVGKSLWKTTDGGSSWAKLYEFYNYGFYQTLFFLDEQTGWVLRSDGLFKTANGGMSWQKIPMSSFYDFGANSVFFKNANNGYISDYNTLIRTKNGGATWDTLYSTLSEIHDIRFVTDNIGYVTDHHRILKTIDGGTNWTVDVGLGEDRYVNQLFFTDANHGWDCGGDEGTILKYTR
jgi:photosystem II stability/assembly factor-like uncharacterized protein